MTEIDLIQVLFFTVGSKQKIKMKIRNTMALSYDSKVSSTQTKEFHFSLVWVMGFSLYLHVQVKSKFFQ